MNHTSISDLKAKAKDQLLGNYGIATGSFALLFVLVYALISILIGALAASIAPDAVAATGGSVSNQIKSYAISTVIAVLSSILTVGHLYILKQISEGGRPILSDLFFAIRNHPDKVIIIALTLILAQIILCLPATLVGGSLASGQYLYFEGKTFLLYIVLYLAGMIASYYIDLMLAMSYMIYLDDPQKRVTEIIRQSISMMKGNKFRYFYMILSFLGYWALILLSIGIAALWVIPYQNMTVVQFYTDLRDKSNYAEVEEL